MLMVHASHKKEESNSAKRVKRSEHVQLPKHIVRIHLLGSLFVLVSSSFDGSIHLHRKLIDLKTCY